MRALELIIYRDPFAIQQFLTGNNLGRLGGTHQLPKKEEVQIWMKDPDNASLLNKQNPVENLHHAAKQLLKKDNIEEALLLLMVADSLPI